ncbi:MAG: hypothetical protein AABZ55_03190 [Bdellovibrionota bacterium]
MSNRRFGNQSPENDVINTGAPEALHSAQSPVHPKGPAKPWEPEMDAAADDYVKFLKDSSIKQNLKDFIVKNYKEFETANLNKLQNRMEHEKEVNSQSSDENHDPGNLSPLLSETMNMHEAEYAYVRAIKSTKRNLVRSLDEKVEEINRLLAGIGGFSSQLKSCFARSTVVFLEQEDPKRPFRERLVFSINLPNYELKTPYNRSNEPKPKSKAKAEMEPFQDGRSPLQATWDDAVNALAHIIASTGLKPKYCKNDRHFGRFAMKQDLRHTSHLPDEYFSFTLDYNTQEKINEMIKPYEKIVYKYDRQIEKLSKKLAWYTHDSESSRYLVLKKQYLRMLEERDYFVATTPDPRQLEEGLLFLIEVSTLKDYHVVKDRMQSIMTKYILHLSMIAAREAEMDPDMEYEMWKMRNKGGGEDRRPDLDDSGRHSIHVDNAEDVPQYEIDISALRPIPKQRKAG